MDGASYGAGSQMLAPMGVIVALACLMALLWYRGYFRAPAEGADKMDVAPQVTGEQSGVAGGLSALDLLRLKALAAQGAGQGPSLSVGYGEKSGFAPEALHAAEQEAWGRSGTADALEGGAPCVSAATAPYSEYLAGAVADPKMRANHARWAKETRPYSGVAMAVDSLEPANYLPWQGLRMPQGVRQSNPLFVTEVDEADLAGNKKFLFNQ